jgi:Zn-dependent protease with chaperone function
LNKSIKLRECNFPTSYNFYVKKELKLIIKKELLLFFYFTLLLCFVLFEYIKIKVTINSLLNKKKFIRNQIILENKNIIKNIFTYTSDRSGRVSIFSIGNRIKNSVYIAEIYLKILSEKEIDSVLLHEEYHLKKNHYIKIKIFYFLFLLFIIYILLKIKEIDIIIITIVIIVNIIVKILINLYLKSCEYSADKYAFFLKKEKQNILTALEKLNKITVSEKSILKKVLETHPSLKKRINRLQRSSYVKKRAVN